jgi:acetyl esterase
MNLVPEVQAYVDAQRPISPELRDPVALRPVMTDQIDRHFVMFGQPGPEIDQIVDHRMVTAGGEIVIRTYRSGTEAAVPGHVLLHGGGWMAGSIDELVLDAAARHRSAGANCLVAAVGYRLAPEHRFPAALDDVIAAVTWVLENSGSLGVDAGRVTLEGRSAGANLAAAALLKAPDLPVACLVLEVPALDLTGATIAEDEGRARLLRAADIYLADRSLAKSPLVSPLLAPDLGGFPPTLVLTAELDSLAPGGKLFAERLASSGVECHHNCYSGAIHGAMLLTASWPTAKRWQDDVVAFLNEIYSRRGDTSASTQ